MARRFVFTDHAWEDYAWWQTQERKTLARINALLRECQRTPFAGTGKPEPLQGGLKGFWSRRITHEHRLVYRATMDAIEIVACRFHYDDG
jgi:toxin YoeB